jgi:hypothetical protein
VEGGVSVPPEDLSESSTARLAASSWPKMADIEYLVEKNRTAECLVILNVGGTKYEVSASSSSYLSGNDEISLPQATWSLLERLPQTRLGKLRSCRSEEEVLELCDAFDPDTNEYKFNRQPRNFNCILNFLNTGRLHLGEETCVIAFSQVRLRSAHCALVPRPTAPRTWSTGAWTTSTWSPAASSATTSSGSC